MFETISHTNMKGRTEHGTNNPSHKAQTPSTAHFCPQPEKLRHKETDQEAQGLGLQEAEKGHG